jgi:zinc protease
VRDKRLVFGVDADHSLISKDPSLFYLSADLLPGKEVAEIEKALDEEVDRLQKTPVDERELEKTKNQMEASFVYRQDSLFSQAMILARYEIALSWRATDDYLPSIRKVTPEDIQRVAKRYLVKDNRTVGILIPLPPKEGKPESPESSIKEHSVR